MAVSCIGAPAGAAHVEVDSARRFGGIDRLYGAGAARALAVSHACVIGIGGVGSWIVEALARSGVGRLTLIDLDHVAESNINRQAHALDATLGQAKVLAMAERVAAFSPHCQVDTIEDFLVPENAETLLEGFDVVVDAIDNVRAKVAIAACCRARRMPLVMAGGAGGKLDPARIRIDDLARTLQDPLLSKVRARLRKEHGFTRDPKKKFGIEAVFSIEPLSYPPASACDVREDEGGSGPARRDGLQGLACAGYGSSMAMTASIGLFCASRALEHLLRAGRERLQG
ncbi:tRNA threonylcarbamoyladenosine dehydratase [Thauera linaloolentis]|uniref:UBA/THIF-type NAD/FAD binding protein n=1 Tax=Thauera linaloolentis (strain DSM 12138 / JCM 21573 / CCUG 41526 / CIP 105981 / IAM 15112 / NBRC 102519 / 47Lol) TaxID=1123367 RepID=N6Y8J5_THAL4|nr:tRNA threonylcarbamoyladenosine dehydratase [Thauera linaloolentis]ENO90626.1 UBA/THIF-type NAD/FAD binding protein [Thauera linaloolentis 47Lol = DSM 12138]MCM8566132.1 tRNA threonylcarbamoyladenosine dehydratase [Thauera linaloolentis]